MYGRGTMPKSNISVALLSVALAIAIFPVSLVAQEHPPQEPQQTQPPAAQQPQTDKRNLWIAKFETETKAAAAVASTQMSVSNTLNYSNLFGSVKTFETESTQPEGTWLLTGKELDFTGGSAAKRALVGFGSGRAHITMEYTLYNPAKKVVWTQKITTKPSFWGSAGALGASQNQGKAMDEQGQKLTDALTKFFTPGKEKAKQ